MRKHLSTIAILLLCAGLACLSQVPTGIFKSAHAQTTMLLTGAGLGAPGGGGGGGLSIDGAGADGGFHAGTVTLSTSKTNDVLVMQIACYSSTTITAITDTAGLTWAQRGTPLVDGNSLGISHWYAVAPSILSSDVITLSLSGVGVNDVQEMTVIPINGANTSVPFDTNASLPTTAGNPTVTFSTTSAHDVLLGFAVNNSGIADTGFTILFPAGVTSILEYQIVSATQSGLAIGGFGFGGPNRVYQGDAVKQ